MKLSIKIIITLILFGLISTSAYSKTIGFPVVIENKLQVPVVIELIQYHAEKYSRDKPVMFTSELLVDRIQLKLNAGEKHKKMYVSAGGGFWVVWKVISPKNITAKSGLLELLEGERNIELK